MNKFIGSLLVTLLIISLSACSNTNSSQGSANNSDKGKTSAVSTTASTVKKVNSLTKENYSSCTFKSHNTKDNKRKSS